MALEDHPRFHEWLAAQERLTEARKTYLAAKDKAEEASLKSKLDEVLREYSRISNEIGVTTKDPIPGVDDLF